MDEPGSKKIDRKKIEEALLADRLGLTEDWLDREDKELWLDHDDKGRANLPDQLPAFIQEGHTRKELAGLEQEIDQLVSAGCHRQVIYFCLEQLSPEAQEIRSGQESASTPGKDGEDNVLSKRTRALATSEDMEAVTHNAKAARSLIQRYQRELLVVAETGQHNLPMGMMTAPENAVDALALLEASLTWVSNLAGAYTAPFETTILKSKGLLYLTAYVSMYAKRSALRAPQHRAERAISRPRASEVRAKKDVPKHDNALAHVATVCTGKVGGWSPSDLFAKLEKFQADYPRLHARLRANLAELHDYASRYAPPSPPSV